MRRGLMTLIGLAVIAGAVFLAQRLAPMERATDPAGARRPGEAESPVREPGRAIRTLLSGACAGCDGEGTAVCPDCRGRRRVETVRQVDCEQCGGSGRYEPRLAEGRSGPCPFCGGDGRRETRERGPCGRCGGSGRAACPDCEGTGRARR